MTRVRRGRLLDRKAAVPIARNDNDNDMIGCHRKAARQPAGGQPARPVPVYAGLEFTF
jgi:hypothetical protein